ncbi:MAG: ATP-binding cassette domain-containing protein [candidate division WOR-3 bacterium]
MTVISISDVYKSYNGLEVLKGVNLRVNKGDFIIIFGEIGAGKSTLIRMMYFQEFPDKGSVEVLGLSSDEAKKKKNKVQEIRKRIGVITQEPVFLNEMTCLENITFVLESLGFNKKLAENRAKEALERVGMADYMNKYPYELSAGQKQKISIARSISRDPIILLADDPTLGLDDKSTYDIEHLFLSLNEMGATIVWGANRIPQTIGKILKVYHLQGGLLASIR